MTLPEKWIEETVLSRNLLTQSVKCLNPAYVTALEDLCKEMSGEIMAEWEDGEFDICIFCGQPTPSDETNEMQHAPTCPVLKAEEYLKGKTQ